MTHPTIGVAFSMCRYNSRAYWSRVRTLLLSSNEGPRTQSRKGWETQSQRFSSGGCRTSSAASLVDVTTIKEAGNVNLSAAEIGQLHKDPSTTSQTLNAFSSRTHTCGELGLKHEGCRVQVCGWLQFRRLDIFALLKDSYGVVQLLLKDGKSERGFDLSQVPLESVICAQGTVRARPSNMINPKMATGEIEVVVDHLEVLNACRQTLPFLTTSATKYKEANEELRLRHRYLDLRNDKMQANLRFRSSLLMRMRQYLHDQLGFVEVETPTLFRRTPGGAREFLVPTENPGQFFCLPQSPQQFKQLLMVGGMDRYFQVARCYRDEGTKRDRQPEFTQLDIEMSFVSREKVKGMIEGLLTHSLSETQRPRTPLPVLTYEQAMSHYGVDKPDMRFGMTIRDITNCFPGNTERRLKCILIKGAKSAFTKAELKMMVESGDQSDAIDLSLAVLKADASWSWIVSRSADVRSVDALSGVDKQLETRPGDAIVIAEATAETETAALTRLGALRLKIADALRAKGKLEEEKDFAWLWVEDFPLFFPAEGNGVDTGAMPNSTSTNSSSSSSTTALTYPTALPPLDSAHHPFTAPHPDDVHLLDQDPLKCRGLHFDLVLNGNEVGGGSIRVHDSDLQRRILQDLLRVDCDQLEHLLTALGSGAPPHGGIALGIDRLVALLVGANSIRDVIAFPKSGDLRDLMSRAPSAVDASELEHYNIAVINKTE